MDENKGTQLATLILVLLLGVALGWCILNMYNDKYSSQTSKRDVATKLSHELDALNAQLRTTIDEQVKTCRAKGVNVYVTDPFPMVSEGIDIETTIILKIKYLNWQVEIIIALSRVSGTSPNPSPSPRPRPGSIGSVGEVGSTSYGDSLPRGLTIGEQP
jgi:hypothetical protein